MTKKLFIGNCDFSIDEAALQDFIQKNGISVSSVQIVRDRYTDRSRGFGFAELAESEDVDKAIEVLNGKELEGRPLTVNRAREPKSGFGGPDGGGDRGPHNRDQGRGGKRGGGRDRDRW